MPEGAGAFRLLTFCFPRLDRAFRPGGFRSHAQGISSIRKACRLQARIAWPPGTRPHRRDFARSGRGVSRRGVRADAQFSVGTAGGDDSFGAVYGRARQHGYPRALQALPDAAGHGQGLA